MSEEQKRKTWIMFKKAVNLVPFNTDIIPKFTSNNTGTDKYGIWKVSATWLPADNIKFGEKNVTPNLWKLFDKIEENVTVSPTSAYIKLTDIITLDIPESIQIKPTQFYVKTSGKSGNRTGSGYIEGYNPKTEQWDKISDSFNTYSDDTSYVSTNAIEYYSKFRFTFIKNYYGTSVGGNTVREIKILSGTIKVL